MPKNDIDYQKSLIYKIQHIEKLELLYIGSTTNFIKRKAQHKENCMHSNYKKYNYPIYKMIRDNEGWDYFKMTIIKEFPCNSKTELLIEEDKLMLELKSNMNKLKAYLSEDEKKEYFRKYSENYRNNNKEIVKEKKKERSKIKFNCECGSNVCIDHKSRHIKSIKHQNFLNSK